MDICRVAKQLGKYLPLFTNTKENYIVSVDTKQVESQHYFSE